MRWCPPQIHFITLVLINQNVIKTDTCELTEVFGITVNDYDTKTPPRYSVC